MPEPHSFALDDTPEAHGVDIQALNAMLDAVAAKAIDLHSFLLARDGVLLAEVYAHPYHAEFLHDVRSVAKSVMSLLVGMALDDGLLPGIDVPVLSFFPGRAIAHRDARKEAITLRHLLGMASGIALSDSDTGAMLASPDWVQFVLDAPMAAAPGEVFNYSTSNAHLLSAIVGIATGQSAYDYARRRLFDPLEIRDVRWLRDPHGNPAGGMGLHLRPRDMLKIGQLALDGGIWNGQRLVSEGWLRQSTRTATGNYALMWWSGPDSAPDAFRAIGYGGQLIFVRPAERAVAVFTAGVGGPPFPIDGLFLDHILPALHETPREADTRIRNAFKARVEDMAKPHPEPVMPAPPLAARISGRRYRLADNWMEWDALTFRVDDPQPTLTFELGELRVELPISQDQVLRGMFVERLGPLADGDTLALRGRWTDERTYAIGLHILGCPEHFDLIFTFDGEDGRTFTMGFHEHVSSQSWSFTGQAE